MSSKRNEPNSLENLWNEERRYPPPPHIQEQAHLADDQLYQQLYHHSIQAPEKFWLEQANSLHWFETPTIAYRHIWDSERSQIEHHWFEDGKINISVNCLDRHLDLIPNKPAIIWQGEQAEEVQILTYRELFHAVCKFANVLKAKGIKKGDRVCIYLPMIPQLPIAMLACARLGAIHSVVFAGFSAESLAHRINDSQCKLLITSNVGLRGGKLIPLKEITDQALLQTPSIEHVIVVKRNEEPCSLQSPRDSWFHEEMEKAKVYCEPASLNATDPLFILYTSGSTGKPKGVVHGQAGYLLYAAMTHRYVFDLQANDVYWCTADIGWVTGHSYVIYGPLANGATTVMFEGIPTYPDPGRFWEIIDKFGVSIFYTAPTAIRSLIQHGEHYPNRYSLDSLRILGTVGEPINPEAWIWYHTHVGKGRCPIVDTWWQTETGGIMISPLPGVHVLKPGSAMRPFFGVDPVIVKEDGTECETNQGGYLCIRKPWPGIMLTTWGDHQRFVDTYFKQFADLYFSGDGARLDEEGDLWLLGRMDDVVNISGHRIGTAEVESALVAHHDVAEAAAVPIPHAIKGQALQVYVVLKHGIELKPGMADELKKHVRELIGPIAVPEKIYFAPGLPKTRSGKIMRRILRKIAEGQTENLGDLSTLSDPKIVDTLAKLNDDA